MHAARRPRAETRKRDIRVPKTGHPNLDRSAKVGCTRTVCMVDFWLQHGSYLGIFLVLVLTGCGLPLPEEVPIIAAGVASSVGKLNPWIALAACVAGTLCGDSVLYLIGYHFGRNLVKAHPRLAHLLHAEHEAKTEEYINRYGLRVLFVARFLVVVRAPVYLTIGILRHPYRKFLLFDAFCASMVVGLFFGLSYAFGDHVAKWIRGSEVVFTVVTTVAVVAVLVAWWVKRRHDRNRPGASASRVGDGPDGGPGGSANRQAETLV
jgi:membrane protein DedA with SNARE-associated domain